MQYAPQKQSQAFFFSKVGCGLSLRLIYHMVNWFFLHEIIINKYEISRVLKI
jgi:hypothetical protein